MAMDSQSGFALFNAIAAAGKTIYEIAQGVSTIETKQELMGVYDALMSLKREAAELGDTNRALQQKLRFKSEDFEFRSPFYFDKKQPAIPLCAKCFAKEIIGPMREADNSDDGVYRRCLVCDNYVRVGAGRTRGPYVECGGGPDWMS
jgi:hypothetical protein